jgi:hypothetical protein
LIATIGVGVGNEVVPESIEAADSVMNGLIYLIGLIVVIMFMLSLLGLR